LYSIKCLKDSGSPVSFLKKSVVPSYVIIDENNLNNTYFGINESKLDVIGNTVCLIESSNKNVLIELLVVTDESVRYSMVVGRDFLNLSNFNIYLVENCESDLSNKVEVNVEKQVDAETKLESDLGNHSKVEVNVEKEVDVETKVESDFGNHKKVKINVEKQIDEEKRVEITSKPEVAK